MIIITYIFSSLSSSCNIERTIKLSNKVLNQTVADAKVSEYIERMITFPFYGTEVF